MLSETANLWQEIESVCQTLKHAPENFQPYELRSLLRQVQNTHDTVTTFLTPQELNIQRVEEEGYLVYKVIATVTMGTEEYKNYLEMMSK